ncbi:DNA-binding GntR family transcriptional regulator [Rhizobium mesoamericanum]|uniref:GntR family transcriptional regulator n=1 Tax=Rhizobium mesoamericanum TaxID=1079800 RepID=UPI00278409B7|nr:GntR family transcriptional regulator [Rhizobium mesoamericanum]MDQ0563193.1 DNA-binding GntR family transcriptional regulator [Rhizobium mesoamericanum]
MTFEPKFKHRNLPEQLADHIVELVATGDFEPGQRLYEKAICERLGVSRVPVREALRILGAQGVVRVEPNRGAYLAELGPDEMAEMLEIRLRLERIAIGRLMNSGTTIDPQHIEDLRGAVANMRRASTLDDQLDYYRSDLSFHSKLIEMSLNPLLMPIWASLSRAILVLLMSERQPHFDYQAAIDDHEQLINLIERGTAAEMDQEIERHINNTRDKRLQRVSLLKGEEHSQ